MDNLPFTSTRVNRGLVDCAPAQSDDRHARSRSKAWDVCIPTTLLDARSGFLRADGKPLSPVQKWLLLAIESACRTKAYCWVSNSTLAARTGIPLSTIRKLLRELEADGYIRRVTMKSRRSGVVVARAGIVLLRRFDEDLPVADLDDLGAVIETMRRVVAEHRVRKSQSTEATADAPTVLPQSAPRARTERLDRATTERLSITNSEELRSQPSSAQATPEPTPIPPVEPPPKKDDDDGSRSLERGECVQAAAVHFGGDMARAEAFIASVAPSIAADLDGDFPRYTAALKAAVTAKPRPDDEASLHRYSRACVRNGIQPHRPLCPTKAVGPVPDDTLTRAALQAAKVPDPTPIPDDEASLERYAALTRSELPHERSQGRVFLRALAEAGNHRAAALLGAAPRPETRCQPKERPGRVNFRPQLLSPEAKAERDREAKARALAQLAPRLAATG